MDGKRRTIEIDEDVAVALKERALERSIDVSDVVAALLFWEGLAAPQSERLAATGHWSSEEIAADVEGFDAFRRDRLGVPWEDIRAWMESWGAEDVRPAPKIRKL